MKFLQLSEFLKWFSNDKTKDQTFTEFMKNAQVRNGERLRPLKDYAKEKNIDKEDLKLLLENIQQRDEYLTRFYKLSLLPRPRFDTAVIKPMKNKHFNNNEESLYKNIIRNMYCRDILQKTKSGIENNPTYMDMLFDLYLHNIIDYKILTPSAVFYMKEGRIGSVFSSYYFRASIMNPYLVYSLNKSVLKGTRIFTPTLGWSSYCYGFLECPEVVEYVGTDVIPTVCEKTRELAKELAPKTKIDIYCKPSEDLLKLSAFKNKYREHFDVVFFSPPYYRLEMYDGKEQSTHKYKTYEEWLEQYWDKTMQLCHHVLQKGGKMCYILSGYGSPTSKEQYDLIGDMNAVATNYFHLHSKQLMENKNVHVTKHRETGEYIMIFDKK
jgi:hypothetical protein